MKHHNISSIEPNNRIESVYLIRELDKKSKKNGEPFVALVLQDATGTARAIMWDKAEIFLNNHAGVGDFVLVKADAGVYNRNLQLTLREAQKVDSEVVELEKFLPRSKRPLPEMKKELDMWVDKVQTPYLKALLHTFFSDDAYFKAFLRAPSARKMHQAYLGGLAEHTLGVVKNAVTIAANYGDMDMDLLITGALLHDGAKVYEYEFKTAIDFTDRGRLLGHLTMMSAEIELRAREIPDFPDDKKMLLQHMVLSHHGRMEYGSPKLPQTAEALVLSYSDYIDAYLSTYFEAREKALANGERWTGWVDIFGSYLYAGEPHFEEEI